MKRFLDVQHPMFRPLWLRLLIVAVILCWAVVEVRGGNVFWAAVFLVSGAYLAHQFLWAFDPGDRK